MALFPVTESTLSAVHVGHFLQGKYPLGPMTECKLFRTGMNHLYMVTDGEAKYVFRIYNFGWRTKTDISEEVRLLTYLKEHHAPVSYPVADNLNQIIQELDAPEGKRYGVLFSFAQGNKVPRFTAEQSHPIGQAVGRIHKLTEGFSLDRITYDTKVLLVDSMERTTRFFDKPLDEIFFLERMATYLKDQLDNSATSKLRRGAVHFDVWFDNMHIAQGNEITIFDFDFCGNGFLCFDVSYFLFQLYSTNQNNEDYEAKAAAFLSGYESVINISDEERRILPLACLAAMTFYLSMQCAKYDTWSNVFLNDDHLKRFVGSLKRWITYNKLEIE